MKSKLLGAYTQLAPYELSSLGSTGPYLDFGQVWIPTHLWNFTLGLRLLGRSMWSDLEQEPDLLVALDFCTRMHEEIGLHGNRQVFLFREK